MARLRKLQQTLKLGLNLKSWRKIDLLKTLDAESWTLPPKHQF